MDYQRPKVGLGVCIVKDGKVLLGKRKGSHGEGSWSFPGGHLELNETWEDCACRETYEEAGIKIKNIRFVTCTNDICYEDNTHYVTIYMLADFDQGEVTNMEPDRQECWEWFEWDQLPNQLFFPMRNLLKTGFKPF